MTAATAAFSAAALARWRRRPPAGPRPARGRECSFRTPNRPFRTPNRPFSDGGRHLGHRHPDARVQKGTSESDRDAKSDSDSDSDSLSSTRTRPPLGRGRFRPWPAPQRPLGPAGVPCGASHSDTHALWCPKGAITLLLGRPVARFGHERSWADTAANEFAAGGTPLCHVPALPLCAGRDGPGRPAAGRAGWTRRRRRKDEEAAAERAGKERQAGRPADDETVAA